MKIDLQQFRVWHSTPYQSIPILSNLTISQICTIDIGFVAGLGPTIFEKSNATVPVFISLSEEDLNLHFTVCEENDTNQYRYRSTLTKPDKSSLFKLVPLHSFLENDFDTAGIQSLLCIKFVSEIHLFLMKQRTYFSFIDWSSKKRCVRILPQVRISI